MSVSPSRRKGGIGISCQQLSVSVSAPAASKDGSKSDKCLLNNVSFDIKPGDFVAVIGASGAGKTTLLNTLMGRPGTGATWSGSLLFDGTDLTKLSPAARTEMRRRMGYVTQDDIVLYTLTPREQIRYRLQLDEVLTKDELETRVDQLMSRLSLSKAADTVIGVPGRSGGISGGERKRVNVALSLCAQPDLLLLDEPTSGLDARKARELCADLK